MHEAFQNLVTLLDGDMEAIKEISLDFRDQMHTDMPTVITHINNGDFTDARKIAHKLKGSTMNFQLPTMIDAFLALESALDNGNQDSAYKYCNQILLELSNFDTLLNKL